MFLSKKHLSRRTVLKGAGATIALPLLDAMVPAATVLAQTAAAPSPRLGFVYFPHGALQDEWTPTTVGCARAIIRATGIWRFRQRCPGTSAACTRMLYAAYRSRAPLIIDAWPAMVVCIRWR